jgi:hypothetical protein
MTEQTSGLPFKVVFIPKEKVKEIFWLIQKDLNKILLNAENGYAIDDIHKELISGDMQLWLVWDSENKKSKGFVISEIIERPQFKIGSVFVMTGTERKRWQFVAMQNLMDWARQNGCYKAICFSRKGWAKVFKAHGFKDTHLALEINLKTNKE